VDQFRLPVLHSWLLIRNSPIIRAVTDHSPARFVVSDTPLIFSSTTLASKTIVLGSSDRDLFSDFFVAFGGAQPGPMNENADPFMRIVVDAPTSGSWGRLRVWHEGVAVPVEQFFFGLDDPDCPYVRLESKPDETHVAFRGETIPQFVYSDTICSIRQSPAWRQAVMTLLWRGFLSLVDDVIFLHAASIGVRGKGFFFVGTQAAGKSTIALALASRGNDFLGDDIACYVPSSHLMLPYRRPVGIRDGPRAQAVTRALQQRVYRSVRQDDSLRVDVTALLDLPAERPLPPGGIVFLKGFGPQPQIRNIEARPDELPALQTLALPSNKSGGKRLMQLLRLLSRAKMFELVIGDPDETALHVEETLSAC